MQVLQDAAQSAGRQVYQGSTSLSCTLLGCTGGMQQELHQGPVCQSVLGRARASKPSCAEQPSSQCCRAAALSGCWQASVQADGSRQRLECISHEGLSRMPVAAAAGASGSAHTCHASGAVPKAMCTSCLLRHGHTACRHRDSPKMQALSLPRPTAQPCLLGSRSDATPPAGVPAACCHGRGCLRCWHAVAECGRTAMHSL